MGGIREFFDEIDELEEETRSVLQPKKSKAQEKVPYKPSEWLDFGNDVPPVCPPETRPVLKITSYKGRIYFFNVPLDREKRYYIQLSRDRKRCRICEAQPPKGRKASHDGKGKCRFSMSIKGIKQIAENLKYLIDPETFEGTLIE